MKLVSKEHTSENFEHPDFTTAVDVLLDTLQRDYDRALEEGNSHVGNASTWRTIIWEAHSRNGRGRTDNRSV